jgi:ribonuclease T2
MKKLLTSTLILTLPLVLVAKKPHIYKEATQECSAFNNMKHTSNTNNIELKVGKKYRILQNNKGQVLTLIEGERVAQRWVDESCFSDTSKKVEEKKSHVKATIKEPKTSNKAKVKTVTLAKSTSKQNLLAISWQNAFCQTHQYKKECKSMNIKDYGATNFVLHGLWPQPRNNQYCKVSKKEIGKDKNKQWNRLEKLDLNSTVRSNLSKLMPGYSSNLHKHEWVKHGTCYGTGANSYYFNAMALLTQVNESALQKYFKLNIGKQVRLKEIRKVVDKAFGKGTGEHVTMNCNKGLVTELWFHIGNSTESTLKELLAKGETPKSRCHKGRIDPVGF